MNENDNHNPSLLPHGNAPLKMVENSPAPIEGKSFTVEDRTPLNAKRQKNSKCRVGDAFQIPLESLPDARQWKQQNCSSTFGNSYGECLWNARKAHDSGEMDLLENITPHDRKESAMKMFHENDYKIDGMLDKIMQNPPGHGMHWSAESKAAFSRSISQHGKKFGVVSKTMNQSVGSCLNFYYGCYKRTRDYSQLKRKLRRQSKEIMDRDYDSLSSGECVRCNMVGELICCDSCERTYHIYCVSPPLEEIPEGDWFCEECVPNCSY